LRSLRRGSCFVPTFGTAWWKTAANVANRGL
jgi:hypothetical protein